MKIAVIKEGIGKNSWLIQRYSAGKQLKSDYIYPSTKSQVISKIKKQGFIIKRSVPKMPERKTTHLGYPSISTFKYMMR